MGNMFDNLGKGLNDFTKQAGKIAGNIGDTAGKITKDVAKGAGKLAGDAGKMTAAVAGSVAQSAAVASGEVSKAADSMAKGTVSIAKNVKDSADKVDLSLASSIERNVTDFLATNNSLISLISNTMTSKFKMNDSERLKSLMDIKKEQDELLQRLYTVDMILGTSMATRDIIELQLLK